MSGGAPRVAAALEKDGVSAEVFTAHRADVKLPLARGA